MFQAVLSRSHEVCELGLQSFRRDAGIRERAETSVVQSSGLGERPATAIEQVVQQVLHHLVQGTRRDRTADVLLRHPGSKMGVDEGHASDPGHGLAIRVRCELAQPFETRSEGVSARQRVPSRALAPPDIAEYLFDPRANLVRRGPECYSCRVMRSSPTGA